MGERDKVARILAAGAVVIAATDAAYVINQRNTDKPVGSNRADLVQTVEAMQTEAADNMVRDCFNENVVRDAFGYMPVTLEGCQEEAGEMKELFEPEAMKTPTPIPEKAPIDDVSVQIYP